MKKKHIALNTQLILFVVLLLVFVILSVYSAAEKEIGFSIMFAVFASVIAFVCVISPLYVAFSEECVEIVYHFGQREIIKWSDIRSISLEGSWLSKGGGLPHFVVAYPRKEKKPFFVVGEIPKTRTTKMYIERYYKKRIVQPTKF